MAYPAGWDPAEEARALAFRLEQRARLTYERTAERRLHGNADVRRVLAEHWLAWTGRQGKEHDPDDPETLTVING